MFFADIFLVTRRVFRLKFWKFLPREHTKDNFMRDELQPK